MQPAQAARPQSSFRGLGAPTRSRGRGRGTGTEIQHATPTHQTNGQATRGAPGQGFRGSRGRGTPRGRGTATQRFNSPPVASKLPNLPIDISPDQIKPHNSEKIALRREKLKEQYKIYRDNAIKNGLMSDDTQSSIDNAIKTRGTCTQLCDEKERVDRIFDGSVEQEEMLPSPETGHMAVIEGRMVKKFRRSAAGTERQIPEELRTPRTLRKTLDYLFTNIIGSSDHLGKHHKFVWDRTRAVRNDFTIQSFTKPEDVKYEVDCYERIVRFHILSLHQMCNPAQLRPGENYDRKQELEQLQKTFASLMDKYDTFGRTMAFRNEPEFRAYFILFAARTNLYDLEVQIQGWSNRVLNDGRVQTALRLHAAAGSTDYQVGSLQLDPIPAAVAQSNASFYWRLLASQRVGYLMACVAEISFKLVRFSSLNAMWRSAKAAPEKGQSSMRSWTKQALTDYLGFDYEDQTEDFCAELDIAFAANPNTRERYLDFSSNPERSLDKPKFNPEEKDSQQFSEFIVEQKRQGRSFTAILNGMSIAQATRAGMISKNASQEARTAPKRNEMFIDDNDEEAKEKHAEPLAPSQSSLLNPTASTFLPGSSLIKPEQTQPSWMTNFGDKKGSDSTPSGEVFKSPFGSVDIRKEQTPPASVAPAFPALGLGTTPVIVNPVASTSPPTTSASTLSSLPQSPWALQTSTSVEPSVPEVQSVTHATSQQKPVFSFTSASQPPTSAPTPPLFNLQPHKPQLAAEDRKLENPVFDTAKNTPTFNISSSGTSIPPPSTDSTKKPVDFSPSPTGVPKDSQPATFSFFPSKESVLSTNPLPQSQDSTSLISPKPQPLPKQPSFGDFISSKTTQDSLSTTSTTPVGSPAQVRNSNQIFSPSLSTPTPQFDVNPVSQPRSAPTQVLEPEVIDEAKLIKHLCRIGLVQQDGILDMFLGFEISKVVQGVFQSFQQGRLDQQTSAIKRKILGRKYLQIWKSIVDSRRLRRRAEKRRKLIAAHARTEQEKRMQKETDLAQIMEAENMKKVIQVEQKKRQEEETMHKQKQRLQSQKAMAMRQMPPPTTNPPQQAGQKRKTLTTSTSRSDMQRAPTTPMHKRSKTLGSNSSEVSGLRASSSPAASPRLDMSTSAGLRRSLSQKSLRQSITQQRLDQTHTDYFRLKAMGIDPETPFVPDTAVSLAVKQQKEEERRAEASKRITARPSSGLQRSRSSTPAEGPIGSPAAPSLSFSTSATSAPIQPSGSTESVVEDPCLKSLREARAAMTSDADWFKMQANELEKEIEQQEKFRRSIGSNSSREDSTFAQSMNGFTRSVSGHGYVPLQLKPGQTLSRTEERIRRTGACGLAKKPIGLTPVASPRSIFTAVPMSRRTASSLRSSQSAYKDINGGDHSRKRSFDDLLDTQEPSIELQQNSDHDLAQQAVKKVKTPVTIEALEKLQRNPFGTEQGAYSDLIDEEEEEEEEEVDEEYDEATLTVRGNGLLHTLDRSGVYYGEEADDEEDEVDEEEEYEEEDSDGERSPANARYWNNQAEHDETDEEEEAEEGSEESGSPTTNDGKLHVSRHTSQALSAATPDTGFGSTVDDAIELSD